MRHRGAEYPPAQCRALAVNSVGIKRPAGSALLEWAQTPQGEEIIEGTLGGMLAGLPMFFVQDQDPAAAALMTASAVAGGIGVGMAGRRIGAALGKKIQPGALADQNGAIAAIARTAGSESLTEGFEQQGRMMRGQVADYLLEKQAVEMLKSGKLSPEVMDELRGVRQFASAVDAFENATPEQRAAVLKQAGYTPEKLERLALLEKELTTGAADQMDRHLMDIAMMMEKGDLDLPLVSPDTVRGLTQAPEQVTGEHVGRAIGRFLGDEIGVLGGVGVGALAAGQLGFQSPKDKEIERLKAELQGKA